MAAVGCWQGLALQGRQKGEEESGWMVELDEVGACDVWRRWRQAVSAAGVGCGCAATHSVSASEPSPARPMNSWSWIL